MKDKDALPFPLRAYRPEDCPALLQLFEEAVHGVAPGHASCREQYTPAQLDAWAPRLSGEPAEAREKAWAATLAAHCTLVAESGGRPVGFADLEPAEGYLDRLYVLPAFRGQGVAAALSAALEETARAAGRRRVYTHASLTARPFFERQGFRVVRRQTVERAGVAMDNFVMEKLLG